MTKTGWTLAPGAHQVRYFFTNPDLAKLLKQMGRFVKENPQLEIYNVHVETRLDYDDQKTLVHEGYILYTGEAN